MKLTPIEHALHDYYYDNPSPLILENTYGPDEDMPVEVFFRDYEDMSELERCALSICEGDILDVGAGVGAHTLLLQEEFNCTALEIMPEACKIMQESGVEVVLNEDLRNLRGKQYDTLLILMNGMGLAGTLKELPSFLNLLKSLIKPDGQIIFDSSDIAYLYDHEPLPEGKYYGEVSFRYRYKGVAGEWFNWLYIDQALMQEEAAKQGLKLYVVYQDEHDQYLGVLRHE